MKKASIVDIIVLIIGVAIVYVLVRPQSQASQLVTALGSAMTAIVRNATDLGSNS